MPTRSEMLEYVLRDVTKQDWKCANMWKCSKLFQFF